MRIFSNLKKIYPLLLVLILSLSIIFLYQMFSASGRALNEADVMLRSTLFAWNNEQNTIISSGILSVDYAEKRRLTNQTIRNLKPLPVFMVLGRWDPEFSVNLTLLLVANSAMESWYSQSQPRQDTIPLSAAQSLTAAGNRLNELYGIFLDQQARYFRNLVVFLSAGLLVSVFMIVSADQKNRRILSTEHRARLLSRALVSDYEKRMHAIALDLHDDIAQDLYLIKLERESVRRERVLDSVINKIRRLSQEIRPGRATAMPLSEGIRSLISDFAATGNWSIDFQESGLKEMVVPFEIRNHIYRIVQEALNNIRKHASAAAVWIRVTRSFPDLVVSIRDDGCGFSSAETFNSAQKGLGLQGMRERVEMIGGSVKLESAPGEGTRLQIRVNTEEHHNGAL